MVRRHYTPELANRSLPLVARIAADIQKAAQRISVAVQELHAAGGSRDELGDELELLRDRFAELVGELQALGVELKDPISGLLDFRARRDGEEVYLCWRLGEDAVAHWHTLDGGFAGRRPMAEF
jgi:hypothetical protein